MAKLMIGDGGDAAYVVCVPVTTPLYFVDNVLGACTVCGAEVQHRPDIPVGIPLICIACFSARATDGDEFVITPKTAAEVRAFFRRH
jgi:hypothetical protein